MNCLHCGEPKIRGKTEAEQYFKRRKYCSMKCARSHMKENKIGWHGHNNGIAK